MNPYPNLALKAKQAISFPIINLQIPLLYTLNTFHFVFPTLILVHFLLLFALLQSSDKMHRSSSTSRASDEFLINLSPVPKGSPGFKAGAGAGADAEYDPILDDATKKETSPHGDNTIHFIPIVLVLCVLTLWAFSHPVDLTRIEGLITEKVERMKIHQNNETTGLPSMMKAQILDQSEQIGEGKTRRLFEKRLG